MPEKKTIERAKRAKREGKSPSTQAGEFVKEEIDHIRKGKHGARSTKQAIAIALSKARRAGVPLKPPSKDKVSDKTLKSTKSSYKKGQDHEPISKKRSLAREKALKRESYWVASPSALSEHAHEVAKMKSPSERSQTAKKAIKTKKQKKTSTSLKNLSEKPQVIKKRSTKISSKTPKKKDEPKRQKKTTSASNKSSKKHKILKKDINKPSKTKKTTKKHVSK